MIMNGVKFKTASASFFDLCPDVKRIILMEQGLDLCSQHNLILVWVDMADVFWKSVDVDVERRWDKMKIDSLEDLEHVGVLVSGGFINMVKRLKLRGLDVSRVPSNVVNNLVKIVPEEIYLENVTGWRTSMLNDAKCKELSILDMELESGSDMRPFMVSGSVHLQKVSGDIYGFMDNLNVDHKKTKLDFNDIDVSIVPNDMLNRFFKSFNAKIGLGPLKGFSSSMLNGINCRELAVYMVHAAFDSKNDKDMIIGTLDSRYNTITISLLAFYAMDIFKI